MNKPDMSLRRAEYAEVRANSVILNFRTTASDSKRYNPLFYNLDAFISGIPAQDHFSHVGKMVIPSAQAQSALSAITIFNLPKHGKPEMMEVTPFNGEKSPPSKRSVIVRVLYYLALGKQFPSREVEKLLLAKLRSPI